MKQPKPDPNPNTPVKTLHAPPLPHQAKDYPLHGQTESTPGRNQVREETHSTRSPRESKRPIERTASPGKS
jgi:hypothetical protein